MPVVDPVFQREKHVYRNDDFEEILKDAVRFFNGTPVHALPPPERFAGSGVYAIYCISNSGIYQKFGTQVNRLDYAVPIYVGKAVPQGWRQGRNIDGTDDGFGNHDPGKERISGMLSSWDTLHPGRAWAERMTGERPNINVIRQRIKDYMVGLR